MLLMASVARAIEIPDPVITIEEGEEYYVVDVEIGGDYELRVFCDDAEIGTPYAIERLDEDKEYVVRAIAQFFTDGEWFFSDAV